MASGPEHYKEAERLLSRDREEVHDGITYAIPVPSDRDIAEALVHAVLANTAAAAQNIRRNGQISPHATDLTRWNEVLGVALKNSPEGTRK
jgi:hypothetical protein